MWELTIFTLRKIQDVYPDVTARYLNIFCAIEGLKTADGKRSVLFQGEGVRAVPLAGHVGFDSMPDQLVNKSVNRGFCFNILCVGECYKPLHAIISASINIR